MVYDTTDGEPLRLDSIAVEAFLQVLGVLHLFVLFPVGGPILQRGRLVHVIFTDVVTVHGGVVDVQLELRDPVRVPVGHVYPLDEELP